MRNARRSFLSLFLSLALAVNLLVPVLSASPLFVEICSGHRTILVPVQDAPEPGVCETCLVCCAGLVPPDMGVCDQTVRRVQTEAVMVPAGIHVAPILRRKAREPPVLSI